MWNQKWILGNWKMNGSCLKNQTFIDEFKHLTLPANVQVGVAAPALYLSQLKTWFAGGPVQIGAQDVSQFKDLGAYTGEISAAMLSDIGATFTLIAHSERRGYFHENHALIKQKLHRTIESGLTPVLCVGETLQHRQNNQQNQIVSSQLSLLDASLWRETKTSDTAKISEVPEVPGIIVAYEPVWAIGTGLSADAAQISAMHDMIHKKLLSSLGSDARMRILYGGSVNGSNAGAILSLPYVDGALVGGASLNAQSFASIIHSAGQSQAGKAR